MTHSINILLIGNAYISDSQYCVIRKVTASTGIITTIAGTAATCFFAGDGGAATSAELYLPNGVALDPAGYFVYLFYFYYILFFLFYVR